jgi:hypothetical protein
MTETSGWVLGRALLPLRAFLGFTFCFAGLQRLANPGFFQASNPGSIQAQLAGSARSSPIHPPILWPSTLYARMPAARSDTTTPALGSFAHATIRSSTPPPARSKPALPSPA